MIDELWSDVRYRVRALFRRADVERELDDELRFHLDRETEKLVAAGIPPHEARRRARLAFGGVDAAKEGSRDVRGTALIESVIQDVRYALRGLRARPAFTAGVVVTLALGIGANTAMFGVVDRLLFRAPATMRDPAHVHRVYVSWTADGTRSTQRSLEFARYLDLARGTHAFSDAAAFQTRALAVGSGDDARELPVTVASASYFGFFDAHPVVGRFFDARDDSIPTGSPVVILGHAFWESRFGGRADVIGRTLQVGTTVCTIVGVAPAGFNGTSDQGVPALYMPITVFAWSMSHRDYSHNYNWSWLEMIVRRAPGVSVEGANRELTDAFRRSWTAARAADHGWPTLAAAQPSAELGPVQLGRGPSAGAETRVAMWTWGVALVVLLVACANVANLLLSRAVRRRREIALRLSLGVGRRRLVRQLLTESLVLAALGGAAGLLVAWWGGASLRALLLADDPSPAVLGDGRTLAAAAAATLLAALASGLAPALYALREDPARALVVGRESGARRSRARAALLVFQAALSVVLLVGAGLFVRSLHQVRTMRLGYDVAPVAFVQTNPRGVKLSDAEWLALERRLLDAADATPGIASATPVVSVPFWSTEASGLYVPGVDSVRRLGRFALQAGSADYFRTTGTRLLRGRAFTASDGANAPPVMVVSEGMARALWPRTDAIGKCVRVGADTAACTTVVGVAEEMRLESLTSTNEYMYYLPIDQLEHWRGPAGAFFVRVNGDATDYVDALRRQLQPLMPGSSYVTVVTLQSIVNPSMVSWQFGATMFTAFGALALVLAALGLYSVMSYGVAQRQQELSVRLALGATAGQLVRLVVGDGVRTVLVGLAVGGALSLWLGTRIAGLLFHESPNDPLVYGAVMLVLVVAALLATAIPALSASRVDPNVALRAD